MEIGQDNRDQNGPDGAGDGFAPIGLFQKEAGGGKGSGGSGSSSRNGGNNNGGGGKILSRVGWRRVVLDECQMVRSSTTQLAVACRCLTADFRWMVSGTPLHAGVDDLNGGGGCESNSVDPRLLKGALRYQIVTEVN